jgi:hypothetical protein
MPWTVVRGRREWRRAASPPFLFQEEFLFAAGAPLASPRVAEPGPGDWTVVDSTATFSVSGGKLQLAGGRPTPDWNDPMLGSPNGFTRRAGRFLEAEVTPTNIAYLRVGWNRAADGSIGQNEALIYIGGGGFVNCVDGLNPIGVLYPYVTGSSYRFRVYDTGAGFLYYVSADGGATWKLLWEKVGGATELLYPAVNNHSLTGTMEYVRVRSGRLRPPVVSVSAPPAGLELDGGSADGIFQVTLPAPASGAPLLRFRGTDAANGWELAMDVGAGTLALRKVVAGAATTVGTTAVGWVTGQEYLLRAICFGSHIRCFLGNSSGPTATDTFNQSGTRIGTGSAGSYTALKAQTGGTLEW